MNLGQVEQASGFSAGAEDELNVVVISVELVPPELETDCGGLAV